ncbi:ClbS/DfsB family four-helix bundle protein [Rhodoferax sp. U11-2br]|uniref:ClbS/DfsB family four-helix bundle protein n=1 Tax=Rhodoferax sp. U11-2br TaxID=2838878 RepID=UPI001BE9D909|nr:ClbS/DfsB family four-helix bundle protein [Rhodoferax sp. U11-2br]MBT3068911.1 ClbS/DfsB family four-helix bundle protein [Rhodoferax sp. U11-2br]
MPLPTSQEELLSRFDTAYNKLREEITRVPDALSRVPQLEGGMCLCDLMAYQIGWGRLVLQWEAQEQAGQPVEMPAPGFKWNQLGALAQSFYLRSRDDSAAQLLAQFDALASDLRAFIAASSDTFLFGVGQRQWAGAKWPVVKWLQVNTIAPYDSARAKLRKWQKTRLATPTP